MKVGDKYYCKNDFISFGELLFSKDTTYSIVKMYEDFHTDENDKMYKDTEVYFCADDGKLYWFLLKSFERRFHLYNFFAPLVEVRRAKLNKLNKLNDL